MVQSMARSARPRWRFTVPFVLLLLLLALHGSSTVRADGGLPEDILSTVQHVNGSYYYKVFESASNVYTLVDGKSGVGVFRKPGVIGAVVDNGIVFSDMGGGSAIRVINTSGLWTIAGGLGGDETGYVDGTATEARFSGISNGLQRINSVISANGAYYLADTLNNAVRVIQADNGTTTTLIGSSVLSQPTYLSTYSSGSLTDIYISDTVKGVIRFAQLSSSTTVSTLFQLPVEASGEGLQPGPLVISKDNSTIFFINNLTSALFASSRDGLNEAWQLGRQDCLNYGSSLTLSNDASELLFINSTGTGVYSISTTAAKGAAAELCPTLKFSWDTSVLSDPMVFLLARSTESWYVLTEKSLFIVSSVPIDVDPTYNRTLGIAAFPADAFPQNNSCLMSNIYNVLRQDMAAAYDSTNYNSVFLKTPLNTTVVYVAGSTNMAAWCGNVTSDVSNDKTIDIFDLWGPEGLASSATQAALAASPWTNTRAYLDTLTTAGWDLGPFCFYNCGNECKTMTASTDLCYEASKTSCDDVCRGAIAASVVMGATALVLIVLVIISPANLFTALVMVPVV